LRANAANRAKNRLTSGSEEKEEAEDRRLKKKDAGWVEGLPFRDANTRTCECVSLISSYELLQAVTLRNI